MFISEVLVGAALQWEYQVVREKEFETLALCGAVVYSKVCTFLDDIRYKDSLQSNVTMLITTPEIADTLENSEYGLVVTKTPRLLFFLLHNLLSDDLRYARNTEETVIAKSAKISEMSYIAPQNVRIGNNVVIEPFVMIYPNVTIGDNTVIRSGVKIGGEGFEFKHTPEGNMPVKHLGGVIIGNNVEIQNNSCVDKAIYPWDNTILEDYVRTDNLVHVAHGVKIGKGSMITAGVTLAGRIEIGQEVFVGPGATVRNGLKIGDNARVNMGSVVTKTVENSQAVSGNFAMEHGKFIEHMKEIAGKIDKSTDKVE